MKYRLTWKEFEAAALAALGWKPTQVEVAYIRVYSHEPEGTHYDFPDYIELDAKPPTWLRECKEGKCNCGCHRTRATNSNASSAPKPLQEQ